MPGFSNGVFVDDWGNPIETKKTSIRVEVGDRGGVYIEDEEGIEFFKDEETGFLGIKAKIFKVLEDTRQIFRTKEG